MPPEQVRAIVKAMEAETDHLTERLYGELAKKSDLQALELKIDAKIEALGTRMVLWMFGMAIAQVTWLYTLLSHKAP